jgi:cobalt-zinc-cadmium efflux system membrane fusion protein
MLRDAETSLREARIKLITDQQALVNLGLPIRLEEFANLSDDQVARQVRLLGLPPAVLETVNLETLTANLLPLVAPFRGEVIQRDIVIGEVVNSSAPQFVLADVTQLWMMLEVRREEAGRVARGQDVVFFPDGVKENCPVQPTLRFSAFPTLAAGVLPGALSLVLERGELAQGQVTWVSPEVDEKTRTVRVRAQVHNPQRRLRPHTFGTGRITLCSNPDALVVPHEAIQTDGPYHMVFVRIDDRTFHPRLVRTGVRDERVTEVQGDLQPDDLVVTTGSHVLKTELFKDRLAGEE